MCHLVISFVYNSKLSQLSLKLGIAGHYSVAAAMAILALTTIGLAYLLGLLPEILILIIWIRAAFLAAEATTDNYEILDTLKQQLRQK